MVHSISNASTLSDTIIHTRLPSAGSSSLQPTEASLLPCSRPTSLIWAQPRCLLLYTLFQPLPLRDQLPLCPGRPSLLRPCVPLPPPARLCARSLHPFPSSAPRRMNIWHTAATAEGGRRAHQTPTGSIRALALNRCAPWACRASLAGAPSPGRARSNQPLSLPRLPLLTYRHVEPRCPKNRRKRPSSRPSTTRDGGGLSCTSLQRIIGVGIRAELHPGRDFKNFFFFFPSPSRSSPTLVGARCEVDTYLSSASSRIEMWPYDVSVLAGL